MSISVFAPASIGNFSVGFDVLGMAVKPIDGTLLGDVVHISEDSAKDSLKVVGDFANKLPSDAKTNIVWSCLELYNQHLTELNHEIKSVALVLDKKMPVGSGLGSSACSVVAALVALNELYQQVFSSKQLLKMMGEMECKISGSLHYDNVAPCYLGGLQLMVPDPEIITQTLPGFDDCYYVMAYPGIEVPTKMAREVLPDEYPRKDLIAFGQNLAAFVNACHQQDKQQAFSVLHDVVAEPYRCHLIPGFDQAKKAMLDNGSLACGISGSGPTLFAVFDNEKTAAQMADWLSENYLQTDLSFVHVCQADQDGARVLDGII